MAKKRRWAYFFGNGRADGRGDQKELLGGKGAGLAEMTRIGLPVPGGFTITTEACAAYNQRGHVWPAGLEVEQLSGNSDLPAWYDVLAACFGFPDRAREPFIESTAAALRGAPGVLRCYLARLAGEPVATSFMVLGAGVAGIHGVGTLPQARRQGIGAAMTLAPLRDARDLGYHVGVLRASDLGMAVYRRLGFRECGEIAIYTWWPPEQGSG